MNTVKFYEKYQTVATQIQQYNSNFSSMTTPQRADGAVENQKSMNKLFEEKLQSEWLGNKVNLLV
jgi:hypothetical protein